MALPTLRILGFIIGIFLITLAASMLVPILTMLAFDRTEGIQAFIWSSVATFVTGLGLVLPGRPEHVHLRPRDMYMLTVSSWVLVCIFAALPFVLQQHISYTDAFFESMSGITATGSTVLSGLDDMSPGILIWRSLLHWLGGIGFIAMAVAILPMLRIGGMRLFQTESSDRSEKVLPRSHMVAKYIVATYVGITLLGSLAFLGRGHEPVRRGQPRHVGDFHRRFLHLRPVPGQVEAASGALDRGSGDDPRQPAVRALRRHPARTPQGADQGPAGPRPARPAAGDLAADGHLVRGNLKLPWMDAFRIVAVNVTSVVTTTGFALGDYSMWGHFSIMLFFYLGFIGGCSGSTAGGIKIFRFQVAYTLLKANLYQLIHPRAVLKQNYNGHRLDEEIVRSILTFSFFFAIVVCLLALGLSLIGLDWMTALTGAASTVAGVGPGMGPIIGPSGNFASLPDAAKWLLAAGMLLGRLEIITVLVLLTPAFWRH